ncbi:MAG: glutathione S-transferase [Zhongshania sp.]
MTQQYQHYGWELSLFSAKTRSYMRFKRIPHVEISPNAYQVMRELPRRVGVRVLPVVKTPEGEWLQDSSEIIDLLEAKFSDNGIIPTSPKQRLIAYLVELWADSFWLPSAMHYRWHSAENRQFFIREAGKNLLPYMPVLRTLVAKNIAASMQNHLPSLGVNPKSSQDIETWTNVQLDHLEKHFTLYNYLLGGRPCLGDFALYGPLYAHLGRDPHSRRVLFEHRPALGRWLDRMRIPPNTSENSSYLPRDEVPQTLEPILCSIFKEQLPFLMATLESTLYRCIARPSSNALPRALEVRSHTYATSRLDRRVSPFDLWKWQRLQKQCLLSFNDARTLEWLAKYDPESQLQAALPIIHRAGLSVTVKRFES